MKTFLFIFLAGYAVRCDDNYYVVRMPELISSKEFKVYWNVPTMQCKSKKIYFDDLYENYGIIQNTNDTHRGDKISILYDPGNFPALIKNETTGEIRYRNGGVPQQGDLINHLQVFRHELKSSIPDKDFSGVGIIDFESWRPILRQNFGVLTPYKDVSYDIERKKHWWWKKQWIQEEAKRRFEASGRDFMQTTISLAKKLRPKAVWGYYGYPHCFNRAFNKNPEACADEVPQENDEIDWLWSESTAIFPSVYSTHDMSSSQLSAFIRGRVKEAARVKSNVPILPYWWYRYRDDGYFTEADLDASFSTFYKSNATGFIIWGSSNDVNTVAKCQKLRDYVTNTLGPAIAKYTKQNTQLHDIPEEINNTTFAPENVTKFDPEYNWVPPENYTQNIEQIVDEELKKENETRLDRNKLINESILIDIILHKIANFCSENCSEKDSSDKNNTTTITSTTKGTVVLTTKNPFKETSVSYETTVQTSTTTEYDNYYDYDLSTSTLKENYVTPENVTPSPYYVLINSLNDNTDSTDTSTTELSASTAEISTEKPSVTTAETSTAETSVSTTENSADPSASTVEMFTEKTSTINISTIYSQENNYSTESVSETSTYSWRVYELSTENVYSTVNINDVENATTTLLTEQVVVSVV
ncbi:hyaluronidase-like isoform X2 [Anticarsia gemmatalis]|uniref:hyaluronidase-like isoform X2 n=1 Tax=Anticarsia gemmatalis TaxID=129554 RepID=UPI003F769239